MNIEISLCFPLDLSLNRCDINQKEIKVQSKFAIQRWSHRSMIHVNGMHNRVGKREKNLLRHRYKDLSQSLGKVNVSVNINDEKAMRIHILVSS
jgi:hypothetical protein